MTKKLKVLLLLMVSFLGANSFGQVTVAYQDLQYTNVSSPTVSVASCGLIDMGLSASTSISVGVNLSKPVSLSVGQGTLVLYFQKSSSDFRQAKMTTTIGSTFWADGGTTSTYGTTMSCTLSASEINATGGTLFAVYTSSGNVEYSGCSYTIKKTPVPTFTLTPTTLAVPCGSTATYSFTVANVNNSPGTLSYNWNVGSGWKMSGVPVSGTITTTANSIALVPNSASVLPSSITVTTIYNGVSQTPRTCTVSRGPQAHTAAIAGNSAICTASDNFTVSGIAAGETVTWSLSNPSVASLSNASNTGVTVTNTGSGTSNIIATITNACGDSYPVSKAFSIYSSAAPPIPSGSLELDDDWECGQAAAIPFHYIPSPAYTNGTITISPASLVHPFVQRNFNVTVTYKNTCTGATSKKVYAMQALAPCADRHAVATADVRDLIISPNPSNGQFTAQLPSTTSGDYQVFDQQGNKVMEAVSFRKLDTLPVALPSKLKDGIYILKIVTAEKVFTERIVLKR